MKEKVKKLYELCFEDSDEFVELYFRLRYSNDVNAAIQHGDEVIAAVQMLPYPMTFAGKEINTAYLSGGCTHPDFRNKGIMRQLFSQSFVHMLHKGVLLSTLTPAESWMFDYYASMGYAPVFRRERGIVARSTAFLPSSHLVESTSEVKEEHCEYLNKKLGERPFAILHPLNDYQAIVASLQLCQGKIYSIAIEGKIKALAFACIINDKNEWCILEVIADSPILEETLVQQIILDTGIQKIELLSAGNAGGSSRFLGMARIINAESMLRLYAAIHPEVEMSIVLSDEQLSDNNGYYYLNNGTCMTGDERSPGSHKELTINQLAEMIFAESSPHMSLMLD